MGVRRRKWVGAVLVVGALLLLAVVTLPLWHKAALRPLARMAGVTYEEMEDRGTNLVFTGFAAKGDGYELTVQNLQTPPLKDLWALYRGKEIAPVATNDAALKATGWKLVITERMERPKDPGKNPGSAREAFEDFREGVRALNRALPSAELANGKIVFHRREFVFGNVRWKDSLLDSDVHWAELASPGQIQAELPPDGPHRVSFKVYALELSARMSLAESNGVWGIFGTNSYKGNRFRVQAAFANDSFVPTSGELSAKNFKLPAKLLGVKDYEQLTGSLELKLDETSYTLRADTGLRKVAQSNDPFPGSSIMDEPAEPEVTVRLEARGEKSPQRFSAAKVSEGKITFPGAEFEIQQGTIQPQMGPPWFPILDLVAVAKTGERQLSMEVSGPANKAEVALSANPALPANELHRMLNAPAAGGAGAVP